MDGVLQIRNDFRLKNQFYVINVFKLFHFHRKKPPEIIFGPAHQAGDAIFLFFID